MLWKSRLLNVAEIPIKKERKVEADTKYENLVFQRESSLFPSGTFQKSEAGTSQAISSFTTLSYRDDYRLTVPCSLCNQEICPSEFLIHKRKHKAMTTMGYTVIAGEKLERGILILKRRFLLSSIIAANSLNEKIKTSIDKAYEFLCMQDNPSYYTILSSSFNSSVHLKKTNNPVVNAVAICEDQNKTWKQVMEDRYVFRNRYGKKSNTCFFGLFDGQHGSTAAEFMAEELPKFLLDQLALFDFSYKLTKGEQSFINSFDTVFKEAYREQEYLFSSQVMSSTSCYDYEYIHRAFAKAFWRMDRVLRLGRKEVSNFYWSGCTAVACLLESDDHFGTSTSRKTASLPEDSEMKMEEQPSHFSNQSESNSGILHIANVGNVHVVLCKGGKAHLLTREHTSRSAHEKYRVLSNGGNISSNEPHGFIEGITQITRGLGFHGNLNLRKSVIPVPQTTSVPIDDTCQFLIAATAGLWDVINKNEAVAIAMSLFSIYEEIYKIKMQEIHRSLQNRVPFLPSISTSMNEDGKIKLLYHNISAFEKTSPESTDKNSQVSPNSKKGNSSTSERLDKYTDSKSKLNSKTSISSSRPFYLYGTEDSDETNSTSQESSNSSIAEQERDRNFFDNAAEYVSQGLVRAALAAGSKENITVLVMLFNGCAHQLSGNRS